MADMDETDAGMARQAEGETKTSEVSKAGGASEVAEKPESDVNLKESGIILALYAVVILLFGGADAVEYFTRTKADMASRMADLGGTWSAMLPVETLAAIVAVVAILACVADIVLWVRSRRFKSVSNIAVIVAAASLTALFACHVFGSTLQDEPSYILVVPLMGLASLVQCANAVLVIRRESKGR